MMIASSLPQQAHIENSAHHHHSQSRGPSRRAGLKAGCRVYILHRCPAQIDGLHLWPTPFKLSSPLFSPSRRNMQITSQIDVLGRGNLVTSFWPIALGIQSWVVIDEQLRAASGAVARPENFLKSHGGEDCRLAGKTFVRRGADGTKLNEGKLLKLKWHNLPKKSLESYSPGVNVSEGARLRRVAATELPCGKHSHKKHATALFNM